MAEEINDQSAECTSNCSTCGANCSSRKEPGDMHEPCNAFSSIKNVIAVVSGKGGVGKSLITGSLAVAMNRKGYNTAVLDADITGPSIPKSFGIRERAGGNDDGIFPAVSRNGVRLMSLNLLLDDEEMPVLWRGPILAGTVKQFWTDVMWGEVDYMFVDMPPGTGDVPLTVFQSLPISGIIVVTSPQELVSMIVAKAVNMAKTMNVPILGVIENYSYVKCPDCGKEIPVFGKSHVDEICKKFDLKCLAKLPLDHRVAEAVDEGLIEDVKIAGIDEAAEFIGKVFPAGEQA
ncbi:MAG: Mrp/NBP35 family ATP-binding protein [Lachnospiraceae bacterium]|jgi:Mrp family chromosome partitioning ATPase|nr:Mrp/NBP35 family ATP-binding protein [Lachnospiraceae bacterium]